MCIEDRNIVTFFSSIMHTERFSHVHKNVDLPLHVATNIHALYIRNVREVHSITRAMDGLLISVIEDANNRHYYSLHTVQVVC